jgi:hypothetical protein
LITLPWYFLQKAIKKLVEAKLERYAAEEVKETVESYLSDLQQALAGQLRLYGGSGGGPEERNWPPLPDPDTLYLLMRAVAVAVGRDVWYLDCDTGSLMGAVSYEGRNC